MSTTRQMKTKSIKQELHQNEVVELPEELKDKLTIEESKDTQLQRAIEILK